MSFVNKDIVNAFQVCKVCQNQNFLVRKSEKMMENHVLDDFWDPSEFGLKISLGAFLCDFLLKMAVEFVLRIV